MARIKWKWLLISLEIARKEKLTTIYVLILLSKGSGGFILGKKNPGQTGGLKAGV